MRIYQYLFLGFSSLCGIAGCATDTPSDPNGGNNESKVLIPHLGNILSPAAMHLHDENDPKVVFAWEPYRAQPGSVMEHYLFYIWRKDDPMPTVPTAQFDANDATSYEMALSSLETDVHYNWMIAGWAGDGSGIAKWADTTLGAFYVVNTPPGVPYDGIIPKDATYIGPVSQAMISWPPQIDLDHDRIEKYRLYFMEGRTDDAGYHLPDGTLMYEGLQTSGHQVWVKPNSEFMWQVEVIDQHGKSARSHPFWFATQ